MGHDLLLSLPDGQDLPFRLECLAESVLNPFSGVGPTFVFLGLLLVVVGVAGGTTFFQILKGFDDSFVGFSLCRSRRVAAMAEDAEIGKFMLFVPGALGVDLLFALDFVTVLAGRGGGAASPFCNRGPCAEAKNPSNENR